MSLMANPTTEKLNVPVLPLRDLVVFPHMIVTLFVGRDKSVKALEEMEGESKEILLLTQKNDEQDDPAPEDLHSFGTIANVLQYIRLPDDTIKVLVEGIARAKVTDLRDTGERFEADVTLPTELLEPNEETEALKRSVVSQFEQYVKLNKKVVPEVMVTVGQIQDPSKLADVVAAQLSIELPEKQDLLECLDIAERLEKSLMHMEGEIGVLKVEKRIRSRVKRQMEKTQREYYLNEQMKAIQKELGEGEDGKDELGELEEQIKAKGLSDEAREKAEAELKKLRNMSPMSAEATVARNYLDWIVGIPWSEPTEVKEDLAAAQAILDEDHYGLEKVKERIVEYLAVQKRTQKMKGPILCLVGPPGVGKTSLGKSIARATGRNFVRMSLGGVRDESEVRGHRRTYIGSMPGKIIQGMKKSKSSNPLFLLDEIEKLGQDWRGDPSSALLEVLDPAQNSSFNDHYLEVDYDLSDVMFITTANSLRMPQPLLDRMEIIRLSGYTEEEKIEIAKRHLIPKSVSDHGLAPEELIIEDSALRDLVRYYTREAGVRNLERELQKLARKTVKALEVDGKDKLVISADNLDDFAGVRRFRYGMAETEDTVGMTTGLAYTEVGGDLLTIESVTVPGKGRVVATGQLGDVMKESVQAAESYVKSRAPLFGIKPTIFNKRDIHVHVPEGATPKDGPSAGVAMVTSIVSLLTGNPVRHDIAMTGEVTLRGRVLPIGGLKEKLLAALRGGIKTVLIPAENEKDLTDIPAIVTEGLEIIPVSNADQVLQHALSRPLTPIDWDEENEAKDEAIKAEVPPAAASSASRLTH
jgi:ATP-dependent Lon protease